MGLLSMYWHYNYLQYICGVKQNIIHNHISIDKTQTIVKVKLTQKKRNKREDHDYNLVIGNETRR